MDTGQKSVDDRKKDIKLFVMDVDGTLTDGKVYMGPEGEVMKVFDISDGHGIKHILRWNNITPAIITGRASRILTNRCAELDIEHVYQGVDDKIVAMDKMLQEFGLTYDNVAYIGDDINDLSCMEKSALAGCPASAMWQVKEVAHFVAERAGGNGAVREFIEWLCEIK